MRHVSETHPNNPRVQVICHQHGAGSSLRAALGAPDTQCHVPSTSPHPIETVGLRVCCRVATLGTSGTFRPFSREEIEREGLKPGSRSKGILGAKHWSRHRPGTP